MYLLKSFSPSDKNQKLYTFEGDLYRIDKLGFCGDLKPVRRDVSKHYREIDSINKLKACLRAGQYTSVGMYTLYFITEDGSALSFDAVFENLEEIFFSMRHDMKDGWNIVGLASVEETDEEIFCDHTGKLIS